jgi:phosphoribosylformylglycinamidine cyclo-ligase
MLPLGYFANVLELTPDLALAISTDGVGTKILVAQEMQRYDTIGIDCVAMNANDVICVGAEPISMVDYIAVEKAEPSFLGELARGLYSGAEQAGINIPAGEIAQIREMLHETSDGRGFDLVGTCVGTVHPDRLIIGRDTAPGDVVVGLGSSGIHSNGLTLARRAAAKAGIKLHQHLPELGATLGEELLTPTFIYVKDVLAMLAEGLRIKALIHITSDGFLNLTRVETPVGYVISDPLPVQSIFSMIMQWGSVPLPEMYRVYNMGTGFCIVVDPRDASRAIDIARRHGRKAAAVGYAVDDARRRVRIPTCGLVGEGDAFELSSESPPACPSR